MFFHWCTKLVDAAWHGNPAQIAIEAFVWPWGGGCDDLSWQVINVRQWGSSLVFLYLSAARFSVSRGDWVMGYHLGEEIEGLMERSLSYNSDPTTKDRQCNNCSRVFIWLSLQHKTWSFDILESELTVCTLTYTWTEWDCSCSISISMKEDEENMFNRIFYVGR